MAIGWFALAIAFIFGVIYIIGTACHAGEHYERHEFQPSTAACLTASVEAAVYHLNGRNL